MTGTPPEGRDWFDKAGQDLEDAQEAIRLAETVAAFVLKQFGTREE